MSFTQTSVLRDLLESCYGSTAPTQVARYKQAFTRFRALYGAGPTQIFRAPGRVNLIGEHTDYHHGFVLPAALDKDVVILACPRSDHTLRVANIEENYPPVEFEVASKIPPAPRGDWSNYLRGPAQMLAKQAELPGLNLLVIGAPPYGVPRSVGLSSSSAIVVATAVALAYQAELPYTNPAFAQQCADAEWYVGTRGGIMDHFAALLTKRDHALFLDCRARPDGSYITRHIPFPASHRLLVVDSGTHHDNIRGEFRPINTSVPGIQISEHFPKLATLMKHAAVLRSMSTLESDHQLARRRMLECQRSSRICKSADGSTRRCSSGWVSLAAALKLRAVEAAITGLAPGAVSWWAAVSLADKWLDEQIVKVPKSSSVPSASETFWQPCARALVSITNARIILPASNGPFRSLIRASGWRSSPNCFNELATADFSHSFVRSGPSDGPQFAWCA